MNDRIIEDIKKRIYIIEVNKEILADNEDIKRCIIEDLTSKQINDIYLLECILQESAAARQNAEDSDFEKTERIKKVGDNVGEATSIIGSLAATSHLSKLRKQHMYNKLKTDAAYRAKQLLNKSKANQFRTNHKVLSKFSGAGRNIGSAALSIAAFSAISAIISMIVKTFFVGMSKMRSVCKQQCQQKYPGDKDKIETCRLLCLIRGGERIVAECNKKVEECNKTNNPEECKLKSMKQIAKYKNVINDLKEQLKKQQQKIKLKTTNNINQPGEN